MKKWFAVIGDPIEHTLSPYMHSEWFQENGIDATYIPIRVSQQNLSKAVSSLHLLGCEGWNVTVPHKTEVIRNLTTVDSTAAAMEAVNTISTDNNGLTGWNTDGDGFVKALEEEYGEEHQNSKILIVGAGGAAKGISYALKARGYKSITITNRTFERAQLLSNRIEGSTPIHIEDAERQLGSFEVIIQTTTVGMKSTKGNLPLQLTNLAKGTIAIDIIYNPLETKFLTEARKLGAHTTNGIGMFVHQGALAFEKWTGLMPDTKTMIKKITLLLEEHDVN